MDTLPKDQHPTCDVKEALIPYMFEAGLDPALLSSDPKLVVEGLVVYNVIDKRRLELDDIATGEVHYFLDGVEKFRKHEAYS